MGGQRGFLAIVGGIIALLVLTVGVVLLRGERPAASFAPDSPEAAFQAYLSAWNAEDDAAAWAAFSARVQAASSYDSYVEEASLLRVKGFSVDTGRSVFIDSAKVSGDSAKVQVTVETAPVGAMQVSRDRTTSIVPMVRDSGAWKIDQLLMGTEPWEIPKP